MSRALEIKVQQLEAMMVELRERIEFAIDAMKGDVDASEELVIPPVAKSLYRYGIVEDVGGDRVRGNGCDAQT